MYGEACRAQYRPKEREHRPSGWLVAAVHASPVAATACDHSIGCRPIDRRNENIARRAGSLRPCTTNTFRFLSSPFEPASPCSVDLATANLPPGARITALGFNYIAQRSVASGGCSSTAASGLWVFATSARTPTSRSSTSSGVGRTPRPTAANSAGSNTMQCSRRCRTRLLSR